MKQIIDPILELAFHEPDLLGLWVINGLVIKGQAKLTPLKYLVEQLCPIFESFETNYACIEYQRIAAWFARYETTSVIALTNPGANWHEHLLALTKNAHLSHSQQPEVGTTLSQRLLDELIQIVTRDIGPFARIVVENALKDLGLGVGMMFEGNDEEGLISYLHKSNIEENTKRRLRRAINKGKDLP